MTFFSASKIFRILIVSFLLPWIAAWAQAQTTSGPCSPVLTNTQVSGRIEFDCNQGRQELQRFARELTKLNRDLRLSRNQTNALVSALNNLLPNLLVQVDRLEGKQDQALDGITELLRRTINTSTPPLKIQDVLSSADGKLLPGSELSDCGCFGKPFFNHEMYGAKRPNPLCLSGQEEFVACKMHEGPNVCLGNFIKRFFGDEDGYAPWARVCK